MGFVFAALLAAAAACGSKGGGAGVPDSAKGALAMLPGDADVYFGLDAGALKSSALFKEYQPMIMAAIGDKLGQVKAKCGFDPFDAAASVVGAMKGDAESSDTTIVISGFKKDQVFPCIQKTAADDGGQVKIDGDYAEMTKDDTTAGLLAVGDDLLFHAKKHAKTSKDELVALSKLPADKSAAGSKSLNDLLAKVNSGATLWVAAKGDSAAAASVPQKFKVGALSIKVTDGLAMDAQATLSSEAEAKSLVDTAKQQLGTAKEMGLFDDFSAEANGADIHFKLSITGDQLKKLASQFGGMMGMGRHHGGMDE
jgi:hypothetical protein